MKIIAILEMNYLRGKIMIPTVLPDLRIPFLEGSRIMESAESMEIPDKPSISTLLFRLIKTEQINKTVFAYYKFERFD
ncbi:MAG: hypothetical protein PVJ67_04055 [Candidatus Pacearchaeota archaeon]|jgi:hypothetical protein